MSKAVQIVLSDAEQAAFGVVAAETGWSIPLAVKTLAFASLEENARKAANGVADGLYASVEDAIKANTDESAVARKTAFTSALRIAGLGKADGA